MQDGFFRYGHYGEVIVNIRTEDTVSNLLETLREARYSSRGVQWQDIDADIIGTLVHVVTGEGLQILLSANSTKTAISVTLYGQNTKEQVWLNSVDEFVELLRVLSD